MSKVEFIVPGVTPESQHRLVYGDVLFNTRNTLELVGKVAIWRDELPIAYYNSNLMRLEFDANEVCSNEYANYALNTDGSVARLRALATGTTSVAAIYTRDLMGLQFVVPPKPEQRAIAGALSDVDALLGGLDRLIAKKRDLKQAAMQQLLTGQTRLPGFRGEWEDVELGEIASIRNTKVISSSTPTGTQCVELESIDQGSGRLLGSVDATGSSSKYSFRRGDVLFGRLRAYLRKYWLATFDGVCSTEIWPLIPRDDRLCASFLHLIVQMKDFADAAGVSYGTHMPRSDWSVLQKIAVRLPPPTEQTGIAAVLSDMDGELAALEARRGKTRDLKQAMMQELLTGKTRLVPAGVAHA
jgi:type I restriction enzyme S subunit